MDPKSTQKKIKGKRERCNGLQQTLKASVEQRKHRVRERLTEKRKTSAGRKSGKGWY